MPPTTRTAALASGALLAALLGGCALSDPVTLPPEPGPGVTAPGGAAAPARPEDPGTAATPPAGGFTTAPVVALVGGTPAALDRVRDAVAALGGRVLPVPDGASPEEALTAAADAEPDVVVVVGAAGLDALDRVSSQRLDQRFLVVGAQLPEPTANVTAVVWAGADARWAADAAQDPEVLAARAGEAVTTGWQAVAVRAGDGDARAEVVVLDRPPS